MNDAKKERQLREEFGDHAERERDAGLMKARVWNELGSLRVRMIREGNDPGRLPGELLVSEADRDAQLRRESLAREHFEADTNCKRQGLMVS